LKFSAGRYSRELILSTSCFPRPRPFRKFRISFFLTFTHSFIFYSVFLYNPSSTDSFSLSLTYPLFCRSACRVFCARSLFTPFHGTTFATTAPLRLFTSEALRLRKNYSRFVRFSLFFFFIFFFLLSFEHLYHKHQADACSSISNTYS
jgi:hypothetical protein